MALDAVSRSSSRPPRSISATCHRPVTMRLISRSGASLKRAGAAGAVMSVSVPDLGLDGVDVVRAHLADRRDLAVGDLPEAEGAGDVAIFVEAHRSDHALIADRLALFQ